MMKKLLTVILMVCLILCGFTASAADDNRQSGAETSIEHKSEEGAEHGKAYAGSKEKKIESGETKTDEIENSGQEDKVKKGKKEK